MIGKIFGQLIEVDGNVALIKISSGLAYRVFVTPRIISRYKVNDNLELYTHLQVREDAQILFGFLTKNEHQIFKMLTKVSGVGPKTAFSIISFTNADDLRRAVKNNDADYLSKIPRLGKKTALKIILELSQKMGEDFDLKKIYISSEDKLVIDALVSLGFKNSEAKKIFSTLPKELSVEEKIKLALKKTSKK